MAASLQRVIANEAFFQRITRATFSRDLGWRNARNAGLRPARPAGILPATPSDDGRGSQPIWVVERPALETGHGA
ncbi:MAG: hypothetical protein ACKV19_18380 [Verrucomicrobiales bacterium]